MALILRGLLLVGLLGASATAQAAGRVDSLDGTQRAATSKTASGAKKEAPAVADAEDDDDLDGKDLQPPSKAKPVPKPGAAPVVPKKEASGGYGMGALAGSGAGGFCCGCVGGACGCLVVEACGTMVAYAMAALTYCGIFGCASCLACGRASTT